MDKLGNWAENNKAALATIASIFVILAFFATFFIASGELRNQVKVNTETLKTLGNKVDSIDKRLVRVDKRLVRVDKRLVRVEESLKHINASLKKMNEKLDRNYAVDNKKKDALAIKNKSNPLKTSY